MGQSVNTECKYFKIKIRVTWRQGTYVFIIPRIQLSDSHVLFLILNEETHANL